MSVDVWTDGTVIESGMITELSEGVEGYNVVILMPESELELGFPVYFEDLHIANEDGYFVGVPLSKDDEVLVQAENPGFFITKLIINKETIFDRSLEQAKVWREIRKLDKQAAILREKVREL